MSVVLLTGFLAATLVSGCGKDKSPGPDTTPPAAVTDLALLRTTETSLTVTWTAPGDDGDKGRAASYDLRYSLTALPASWDSATVVASMAAPLPSGEQETVTVSGLTRDRIYYLALQALDDAGNASDLSNVVQARTADPTPPGQVTDLEIGTLEPRAVTLLFTATGDDEYVGTAAAYEVRKSTTPVTEATWESATEVPVTQTPLPSHYSESIRVTGFAPQETVHIALRARDDGGNVGQVSNDVEVTLPPDTVAPAAIRDLALEGGDLFELTLTWTAPGNDGNEGRAAAYALRYAKTEITAEGWDAAIQVQVTLIPKAAGEREEVTLTGLPGGRDLWISVRAVDEVGNWSPVSNAAKGYVRRTPRAWTIRVDGSGEAPSIQAGIDSASAGDTVRVHPGTYNEAIDFLGKDLLVASTAGPEETTIDATGTGRRTVTFTNHETRAAQIVGFTITGGVISGGAGGAGVYCAQSSPSIIGNVIRGNGPITPNTLGGGGIQAGSGYLDPWPTNPLIAENEIVENTSYSNGGGIWVVGDASAEIRRNRISGNACRLDGGGIWIYNWLGAINIVDNVIIDNTAGDHGGGIYAGSLTTVSFTTIERNEVRGNLAKGEGNGDTGSGGGIALLAFRGLVRRNTIVLNVGGGESANGGGGLLFDEAPRDATITANIIALNVGTGAAVENLGNTHFLSNLLWANEGGDLASGIRACPPEWSGQAAIADPLFCDPENADFTVASNSPALTDSMTFGCYPDPGCSANPPPSAPATWERLTRSYH